jgi:PhzF family phenazine biosynthesis protein
MEIPIYQVDAFTDRLFGGNPAAVCPLAAWLPDTTMQAIAAENNLSETAFFVAEGGGYRLRWFTPVREVDLCGHATLATGHVILRHLSQEQTEVTFVSRSGRLTVAEDGDRLVMDLPSHRPEPADPPAGLIEALGGEEPEAVLQTPYPMVVYHDERAVRRLDPRLELLVEHGVDEVLVTAPGTDSDFVSRFFAPGLGIPEDPVTGSAHCALVPYWAGRLSKNRLFARQISARGGELHCELRGSRVLLAGSAVTYLVGTIATP